LDLLITNGTIVTMNAARDVLVRADLFTLRQLLPHAFSNAFL